jgi:hypothetical protein
MVDLQRRSQVRLRLAPDRVGHIIGDAIAEQLRAKAVGVREREPVGKPLTGRPVTDQLTTAEELLERECTWPRLRCCDDGMPQLLTGHRDHEVSSG